MMTIKLLKDGKVCKVARSYAMRMIEQGLATVCAMPKKVKAEKPEPAKEG